MGALALCVVMPTISFYLWSAVAQHGGSLWLPASVAELVAMVPLPTWDAAVILFAWIAVQAVLYVVVPAKVVQGWPTEHGERAEYRINGLLAFGLSAALLVAAIAEIVDNAVRHATSRVDVSFAVTDDRAVVTIDDDGPGLDDARREALFQSTLGHGRPGGLGLGTWLAHEIVRRFAGDVRAPATPERTRFELDVPTVRR